ncbi:hypothetical protein [Thalassobaculum litoreum]|uniref:hypothetical protein n=1 Tax=Thalassobaculum litoreum TaxID=420996 RepID=UPI000B8867C7|nr:hypothetical protein [Thalassobaculum litoreum]
MDPREIDRVVDDYSRSARRQVLGYSIAAPSGSDRVSEFEPFDVRRAVDGRLADSTGAELTFDG